MPQNLWQALIRSWTVPFWPTLATVIAVLVYLRGWRLARLTRHRELPPWRAACFVAGALIVWLALASPVDALGDYLLVAHMAQHLLLMSIAPPLLVLGCPTVPLLRGLPRKFVAGELARWMNSRPFQFLQALFTRPAFAWVSMTVAVLAWHIPAAYEMALHSESWHEVEHACFFFTSLCFWWVVLPPWPGASRFSRWMVVPYLVSAHLVTLGLATFLALYNSVIYSTYASGPRLFGISPLADQNAAGGEMLVVNLWVLIAVLAPILIRLLSEEPATARSEPLLRSRLSGDRSA